MKLNSKRPSRATVSKQPAFDARLLRYPTAEASALLRQSRAKTYLDIKAGTLLTIKDGRRRYVPGSEIARRCALPSS
jgi:hypothetical protein